MCKVEIRARLRLCRRQDVYTYFARKPISQAVASAPASSAPAATSPIKLDDQAIQHLVLLRAPCALQQQEVMY
jgi:hypothetical protein